MTIPTAAVLRRNRNGSNCHKSSVMRVASSAAVPTFQARPGTVTSTNEIVARSTSITSTNVAVIMRTLCLNRDSSVRMTISASDSAAAVSGRRNSTSQRQLSKPQARTKAACAAGSTSDEISRPKAARWIAARSAIWPAYRQSTVASRFFRSRTAGGMVGPRPRPGLGHRRGASSSFCNRTVMARARQRRELADRENTLPPVTFPQRPA